MTPLVLAVVGPTATGKSELGLALAQWCGAEIINADAMQLYRGMDIGTAKLAPEERRGIPHHLLDVLEVQDDASVAGYQRDARAVVEEVHDRGHRVVVVGGSGLYLRALVDNLEFPGTDPVARAALEARATAEGTAVLHRELASADPAAAAAIPAANTRRVIRALEVIEITGRPFSATLPDYGYAVPAVQIGLDLPLDELDARIAQRVERMWQSGLVDEVRALADTGLRGGRTASRAVGYAEVLAFLDGRWDEATAREAVATNTRRLARRQLKWFRRDPRVVWLDARSDDLVARSEDLVAAADAASPASSCRPRRSGPYAGGMPGTATRDSGTISFTKGHGTENDFVLLADPEAELDLTAPLVRALTDRRAGIGGDGVIRAVRCAALDEGREALAEDAEAEWFMDYRNADGSTAEMCGNGVRVFAAYLESLGLADLSVGELAIGTRSGIRRVRREANGWYAVDMGEWSLPGGDASAERGADAEVMVRGLEVARAALRVDVGNPHTVLALADQGELATADLSRAPSVEPDPPAGTNVELVVPLGEREVDGAVVGQVRMRVFERGVGETRSCGTGACAAALAVRAWAGVAAPDVWLVDVPGGQVRVSALPGGHVELAGPAVLVATGVIDLAALPR